MCLAAHVRDGSFGHRLFDRIEDFAHVVVIERRPNQHMRVFGHDDVGPDMDGVFAPGSVQRIDEPLAAALFAQEFLPTKTGERQRVSVTRFVVTPASLAVGHR